MRNGDRQELILQRLVELNRPARRDHLWLAAAVLVGVGCWMLYLASHPVEALSVWDLQDHQQLWQWSRSVTVRYCLHAIAFFLLGVALPIIFVPRSRFRRAPQTPLPKRDGSERGDRGTQESASELSPAPPSLARRGLSLVVQDFLGLAYVIGVVIASAWLFGQLAFPMGTQSALETAWGAGSLALGLWIGLWRLAGRARVVQQALLIAAALTIFASWLFIQIVQRSPLGFEPPTVTSRDRRELVEVLQRSSTEEGDYRIYRLSESDLNRLIAWSFSVSPIEGKAQVAFSGDMQQLEASLQIPWDPRPTRYINLAAAGRCEILDQQLDLSLDSLQLGGIRLPKPVSRWLGRFVTRWISSDPYNMELLAGVVSAVTKQDRVEAVISDDGLSRRRLAKVLRHMGAHPDVSKSVDASILALADLSRNADRKEPLFERAVRRAFQQAAERSRGGGDPVRENRAAILALGIALGHLNVEKYVGVSIPPTEYGYIAVLPRQSQLRARADWSRHFWVSAAITLLVSDRVSDVAGLLKEELDSGEGGSGFSFGDLMADRAGTEFARAATRDRHSALAVQNWVLHPNSDLNDLMPPADDLPEGLTDAQLDEQFDGVSGPRYQSLIDTMEQRLRNTEWWTLGR